MSLLDLLTCALATWYISYILTAQDGPFLLLKRLRAMPAFYKVLQCIYCTSPYVAALVYLAAQHEAVGLPVVQVIAIAGGALMLRSYTGAGANGF